MLSLDEIILRRRSIRKYKAETPPRQLIEAMLKSAAEAPSPSNSQPVRFIRLGSESVRSRLREAMTEGRDLFLKRIEESGKNKRIKNRVNAYYRFSEFMFSAPLLFAVGVEKRESLSDILAEAKILSENRKGFSDEDISTGLALKAFMLKGTETGIGTCILTAPLVYIKNPDEIIGAGIRINSFITAGFPDESPAGPEKKDWSEIHMEV